jgi:translation initiation factor 2B subunit (eIF-2B alpha/beta/delta family)
VGAHAVMANGGVLAPVGLHMAALAAKRHAVPFVVLCGLHKVGFGCPVFQFEVFERAVDFDLSGFQSEYSFCGLCK